MGQLEGVFVKTMRIRVIYRLTIAAVYRNKYVGISPS